MRKIREILRLHFEQKLGQRQIARSVNTSQSTVHDYLARMKAAGLTWPFGEQWCLRGAAQAGTPSGARRSHRSDSQHQPIGPRSGKAPGPTSSMDDGARLEARATPGSRTETPAELEIQAFTIAAEASIRGIPSCYHVPMSWSSAAGDPEFRRRVRLQAQAIEKNIAYHSLDLGNGEVLPGIISIDQLEQRLNHYPLPQDLRGKRVLDIGAASGWNSFEAERRGAEVVAIDCVEYAELTAVKRLRGSKIDYAIVDIDELTPERFGLFDYVIFFGVLYHVRHPLLALERVCSVTRGDAYIESYVVDSGVDLGHRSLEFYETDELGGQIDNWFGPTTGCLLALTRSAGFPMVHLSYVTERRAGVLARRKWDTNPITPIAPPPFLCFAHNNRHDDAVFQSGKDEYICVYFLFPGEVTRDTVFVHVDQFGIPPLILARTESGHWQVNVRVPPGLMPGIHSLTVSVAGTLPSNPHEITILPAFADRRLGSTSFDETFVSATTPELIAAVNSADRTTVFRGYRNETLGCRFVHPDSVLKLSSVQMLVDDAPYPLLSIGMPEPGMWQVSARLRSLTVGEHAIRLRIAGSECSNALTIVWDPLLVFL